LQVVVQVDATVHHQAVAVAVLVGIGRQLLVSHRVVVLVLKR
jgi:hypothetical protein